LEFGVLVFVKEGKQEKMEKTLRARQEPTTNSTHIWYWARIEPGHTCIDGRQALSPLCNPCSPISIMASRFLHCKRLHFMCLSVLNYQNDFVVPEIYTNNYYNMLHGRFSGFESLPIEKC